MFMTGGIENMNEAKFTFIGSRSKSLAVRSTHFHSTRIQQCSTLNWYPLDPFNPIVCKIIHLQRHAMQWNEFATMSAMQPLKQTVQASLPRPSITSHGILHVVIYACHAVPNANAPAEVGSQRLPLVCRSDLLNSKHVKNPSSQPQFHCHCDLCLSCLYQSAAGQSILAPSRSTARTALNSVPYLVVGP